MTHTHLFGEKLFTQGVEGDELSGENPGVDETFSHQHDLTDQLKVWDDHGTGSEKKKKKKKKTVFGQEQEQVQNNI